MKAWWLIALITLTLSGCEQVKNATGTGSVAVSVDAVNYMHDWDVKYTLTDLRSNEPVGGAIVGFMEGPGAKGCCVSIPVTWQPGIKLRVEWTEGDKDKIKPETYRRDVELPRYEKPGDMYVLFYPKQEIEVRVSDVEPGNPGWAGRIKEPAYPACVKRLGEKECRKLLPKYAIGSDERFAADMRAGCTPGALAESDKEFPHMKDENRQACIRMKERCLQSAIQDKKMCELDYKEAE